MDHIIPIHVFVTLLAVVDGTPLQNILMIVVDDLRPQIGAYGVDYMHTPNIDKLAADGVLFEHAYSQQAICSPTRNSFLSGRYPDKTKVYNFFDNFRNGSDDGTSWIALPEFFKRNGYYTTGAGKIYHPNHPPHFDNDRSWTTPWLGDFGFCTCAPAKQASCEGLNLPVSQCQDEIIVSAVVEQLNSVPTNQSKPWFIAAGLHKPHLPFYAPERFYDMYNDTNSQLLPKDRMIPNGMPYKAWHSCLSNSSQNNSNWGSFTDIPNDMELNNPMDIPSTQRLRRGYYASVSYTDSNIGKILDAAEPYYNNTIVLLVGDHGWSLGEQNVWCKMTNFENGVRVPLLIRAPHHQVSPGFRVSSPVEMVDIYRTLVDLSGLSYGSIQASVDGKSLKPLLNGSSENLNEVAQSQFPRCYAAINKTQPTWLPRFDRTDCQDIPRSLFDYMGYSVRSTAFRYTEWRRWNGTALDAFWDDVHVDMELYDHRSEPDPFGTESINLAYNNEYSETLKTMQGYLRKRFQKSL
eukprot:m.9058 g.9058  ORF g.9058 m.9058 type:complete len:519 (+) comp4000_c0_seq1:127-1683(+)